MGKQNEAAVVQVPDWETPTSASTRTPGKWKLGHIVNRMADLSSSMRSPDVKTLKRPKVIIMVSLILVLIALILGLSIGLTVRHSHDSAANLPLPTGSTIYHGDLTYYEPGLGACGITSTGNDDIVAISHSLFDSQSRGSDPNANRLCGRTIRAQRVDNGITASVDLRVVDRCVGCAPNDIDVSLGAFKQLADPNLGRVGVDWAWV